MFKLVFKGRGIYMRNVKLENIKHPYFKCEMCTKPSIKKPMFKWTGMIIKEDELYICRNCAYREAYGSRDRNKAKKEKWLENEQ